MKITGKTRVAGIFGFPITHTLSPLMQNAAFEEAGLNFVYLPFSVRPSELEDATRAIRALDMVGVNVTIPHKERIKDYLDELSPDAELIGAVNTVVNRGGRLTGYNTDWRGFSESLRDEGLSLKGKKAVLLGAGGAALSICFALIKEKIQRLVLVNRTFSRAKQLAEKMARISNGPEIEVVEFEKRNLLPEKEDIDLLINATCCGMHEGDPSPVNLEKFPPSLYVYDVVYNRKTELLKDAEKIGLKCQGGLEMLIWQGALSFELWTGKKAPLERMRQALMEGLRLKQ